MGYLNKHATLVASTLISLASLSHGLGSAIVENHCSYPAHLWSVSNTQGPEQILQPGQSYSETWQTNPAGGGISIKVAEDASITGPILQFEYTLLGILYYDLSRINGSPFESGGVSLVPSDSSCNAVRCAPNGSCGDGNVFYEPDDNSAIEACQPESSITLTLCSGQTSSGMPKPGKGHHVQHSPPVPNPVPAPAPASTPASVPVPAPSSAPPVAPSSPVPAPPAPPAVTSPAYVDPNDVYVTTFITYYKTVDATVDDIVTVTAK